MAVGLRIRSSFKKIGKTAFTPPPVETPGAAFGGATTRAVSASYGQVAVPVVDITTKLRGTGIEAEVRRNTNRTAFYPTWSYIRPTGNLSRLPRPLDPRHPATLAVGTGPGPVAGVAPQPRGRIRRHTGAMGGRVTQTPKPRLRYPVQGKGKPKPPTKDLGPQVAGTAQRPGKVIYPTPTSQVAPRRPGRGLAVPRPGPTVRHEKLPPAPTRHAELRTMPHGVPTRQVPRPTRTTRPEVRR